MTVNKLLLFWVSALRYISFHSLTKYTVELRHSKDCTENHQLAEVKLEMTVKTVVCVVCAHVGCLQCFDGVGWVTRNDIQHVKCENVKPAFKQVLSQREVMEFVR